MVPTFTWGFVRSNFCLAIASLLPACCLRDHRGPECVCVYVRSGDLGDLGPAARGQAACSSYWYPGSFRIFVSVAPGYSPVARAMISLAIDSGTSLYASNCIVYVARPWVR